MKLDANAQAFLALVRAGLWGDSPVLDSSLINWPAVYRLAGEQALLGLVLQGIERSGVRPPKELLLQWISDVQRIERHNSDMNEYVGRLMEQLRGVGVSAVLVKGQGIAQCYEKPLWRSAGDIDLLLREGEYDKANAFLIPLAVKVEQEFATIKHLGMSMPEGFEVELHGNLHSRLSRRVDRCIDAAQKDVLVDGNVRHWQNGATQVLLPAPDDDVLFLFTHIVRHFFIGGIGLRQICDWCRFLWTYRAALDRDLLARRVSQMGLESEWRAFAALAVDRLGMPVEAMPFYSSEARWSRKADRILDFVLETGNFGHNRAHLGAFLLSALRKMSDFARHVRIFPLDSVRFFFHFFGDGVRNKVAAIGR